MNADAHFQKAREHEDTIGYLLNDPHKERHLASLVEDAYGAAQHLIAYALQTRHGSHLDTHAGVARLLREQGYGEIADFSANLMACGWGGGTVEKEMDR